MNWTPPPSPRFPSAAQQQPQRQPLLPPFSALLSSAFMGAPAAGPSGHLAIPQPHYASVDNAATPSEQLRCNYCYHHQPSYASRSGPRWTASAEGTAAGDYAHPVPFERIRYNLLPLSSSPVSSRCAPDTTISRLLWTVIQLLSIKIANLAEQVLSGRATDKDQMTVLIAKLAGYLPYLTLIEGDAALKLMEAGSAELESIPPSPPASLPTGLPLARSSRSPPPPQPTLRRASRSTRGTDHQGKPGQPPNGAREGEETAGACGVDSNDDEKGGASTDGGGAGTAISAIVEPRDSSLLPLLRAAGSSTAVASAHTIPAGGEFWPHQPPSQTSSPPSPITPPLSSPGFSSPRLARPTTDSGRMSNRQVWFHGDRRERCMRCGAFHQSAWRRGDDKSRLCNACGLEWPHNKRVLYDDERAPRHTRQKRARKIPAQQPARVEDEMVEGNGGDHEGGIGLLP